MDVKDKVAIVTGSATGMGRSTALMLAERGCHVVANFSQSAEEAAETARDVEALGVRALTIQADISSDEQCRAMVAQLLEELGRLDVLVNNAGAPVFVA